MSTLGVFPLARLATVWFMGVSSGSKGYHFITSFLEVPSEPKRDFTGDVATSKALIGSDFLTKGECNSPRKPQPPFF